MYEILSNYSVVSVVGNNSRNFLQKITTNDVLNKKYSYNYILNNQARYLFDCFVYQNSDTELLIEININQKQSLIDYLVIYKLNENIEITDVSDEYYITYSNNDLSNIAIMSFRDPRYENLGYRSIFYRKDIVYQTSKLNKINDLYIIDKYKYGIIDGYIDLIAKKSIPIEYGADELSGISYSKGCYIGQELISRTKYQGVVRKNVYQLISEHNIDHEKEKTRIWFNNKKIGIFCSIYQNQALVLLNNEDYSQIPSKKLTIENNEFNIIIPHWYNK
ncbi:CAF17-like 4Fe-4S cluster assembly/insertion protein YgfZ [Rickettsia endosymbiont of Cardiosporidium cionae]|uniref:CAF17-like 4Fe-4S cluster assembly/insertion protein YgfZ n=1 Tax=Rickettsia endosymbiont of Cardiosporidium cionae TaxID=2777155 RepID=UPI0018962E08|nr:folate-binding protein [Rickettsia endosymbiont of Cardiosporidium cionae]KAF8818870.1 folate-binding protein [Rickettsia endosymbiont of Cardiosporidium cionae]